MAAESRQHVRCNYRVPEQSASRFNCSLRPAVPPHHGPLPRMSRSVDASSSLPDIPMTDIIAVAEMADFVNPIHPPFKYGTGQRTTESSGMMVLRASRPAPTPETKSRRSGGEANADRRRRAPHSCLHGSIPSSTVYDAFQHFISDMTSTISCEENGAATV